MTTVLFWDIDGTLLNSNGAGLGALTKAASQMMGKAVDLSRISLAGMTDWAIATEVLEQHHWASGSSEIKTLLQLYCEHLPESLLRSQGFVLSGVKNILSSLHQRDDVLSLILTGNIATGGWAKLSHYGLNHYFKTGAFCEQSPHRNDIAKQALALAEEALGSVALEKCLVIGDTPHDIRCGQAIGVKTVGIASGRYSAEELTASGSPLVYEFFPQPEDFMREIGLIL